MFQINQPVLCIKSPPIKADTVYGDETIPSVGKIYHIREVATHPLTSEIGFHLTEISNEIRDYRYGKYEVYFDSYFFRPLMERKASKESELAQTR
jgi:hypothetical protein